MPDLHRDFISVKPPLPKTKKEAPLPALLERAKEGDMKGVVGLLEELGGGAIDVVDRHGSNALSYAAGYGDEQQNGVEMVVLLLRHGFPVDGKDRAVRQTELDPVDEKSIGSVQRTPLMWACRNGKLRIARLLVRFGADCRRRTSDGTTCLHWAFWQRQIQTCRYLLGVVSWCSPRINETNSFDCSAVHFIGLNGSVACMKLFIAEGGNVYKKNKQGHTVVHKASWRGRVELLQWLRTGTSPERFDRELDELDSNGYRPIDVCRLGGAANAALLEWLEGLIVTKRVNKHLII
ncbi:hypothetical protein TeGR_g8955 [Tetraparma gracilis]|uniref:Ankyrin repeat-containing domain protein n=1 Tax=Tetraparma gracilis TaxID=2962635 RepID=A0ABQ6NFG2_9STRA|nr:hypothetical protein TeGR_g8955 [Tetraparma gracilis]